MRNVSAVILGAVFVGGVVVACGSKDQNPPPQTPAPSATPYPGAYPPPQGTYPPPQGTYPPPTATGTAPVAGQLATPGPMAFPCSNDSACGTHKCNTQYGKCAYPCQSDFDCIQGASCLGAGQPLATCVPKPPGSP
jgi:hypothetical protein